MKSGKTSSLLEEGGVVVSSSYRHTLRGMKKRFSPVSTGELEEKIDRYSLSGWTLGRFRERGFPLSAHSDFNGLVQFAKSVNPRIAHCFTENGVTLSDHLSGIGINAVPL
ncbi:hypothetical protein EU546_07045 [Candidatus Thorarchaeota archaeon]|nr:MAG: hypothetical protein EU546_07045 [Candidatus Thorarchaeota archaeon]